VLDPGVEQARTALQKIVDYNIAASETSISQTLAAVSEAKIAILVSFSVTLVLALICGYFPRAGDQPAVAQLLGASM